MSTALSEVIAAVRVQHPAFDPVKVGDGLIAQWMTQYQRRLMQSALNENKQLVIAVMPFTMIPSDDNAPPYAGAGQVGALPADSASGVDTVSPDEKDAGFAVTVTEGAVLVAESKATSGAATTLTKTGAAWTVNAYVDKLVKIVRGLGAGQKRQVISNTADTLTVDGWVTIPDATSIFVIVSYTLAADAGGHGLITDFPQTDDRLGYMVKTDSAGVAYIDWTAPVLAKVGIGIALPQNYLVLGGTVYYDDGEVDPLTIVGYKARFRAPANFPVYIQNNELYLVGGLENWEEIASFELRYVPVPPALTARTSLFILPDSASDALISFGALKAAKRVAALGVQIDARGFAEEYVAAEQGWLQTLSQQRRSRLTILPG